MFRANLRNLLRLRTTFNNEFIQPAAIYILPSIKLNSNIPKPNLTNSSNNENNSEEKEYLTRSQLDPDTFGLSYIKEERYEDDIREDEHISNPPTNSKRLSTKQYADIIKALIKKKQLKEAIDFVEIRMIKEDRVKPENYIFNLLLGACGRAGYTKKAFSLYNEMKRRALPVTPGTYTALFNACSNSPWIGDGLTRAKHLHNIMIEKHYEPNDSNYNAMIKAYGRCGDLNSAFALVDEMVQKHIAVKDDTLNFLLQACITDKEAGYRHALLVWRKFIDKRIPPSIYSYNLMLRCIRDCGMGDINTTNDVLQRILPENDKFLQIGSGDDANKSVSTSDENRPNLMAPIAHLGNIISLSEIKEAEHRLLLVGGANSFLQNMSENHCAPDIKTFTQIMDCIPNTLIAEKDLIIAMKRWNVKPDLDFYNMLIKRRSMRLDYEAAIAVLKMIKKARYMPDLITYGVLALGCQTKEEAADLIVEMKEHNYRLNTEILGAMLKQGCMHFKFSYVMEIMDLCVKEEIPTNQMFFDHLDQFKSRCKRILKEETNDLYKSTHFQKGFQIFKMRYKQWLEQIQGVQEEPHPWQQFRQNTETDIRHFKDKDTSRFKARHTSLFKQKTSMKYTMENNDTSKYGKYFKKKPKRLTNNNWKPKEENVNELA